MKIIVFNHLNEMLTFVTKKWQAVAHSAIAKRGVFTVALSGGTSPLPLYHHLSEQKDLPWERSQLFLVDERFVPLTHKDSNGRMIKETLLTSLPILPNQIHFVPIDSTPSLSAEHYEKILKDKLPNQENSFPAFDLILLGLGEDGHTASLFPDSSALLEKKKWVRAAESKNLAHARITLTLPLLNQADNVIFFVQGERKAAIVKRVFEQHERSLPATKINPVSGKLYVVLDNKAGDLIKYHDSDI